MSDLTQGELHDGLVPVAPHWREGTTEPAILITQQAVEGLASRSLRTAA